MKSAILSAAILAFAMTTASADPIADREAYMKENGRLVGAVAAVVKGEKPFDAAEVLASLEALNAHAQEFDAAKLFPAGSEGEEASPAIWTDQAGFEAAATKFKDATAAAVTAAPQHVDALRATVGEIGGSCSGCHKAFRIDKG